MPLYYLDIETTGLDPYQDELLTIQTHRLEAGRAMGTTKIHRAWMDGGEKAIVRDFLTESDFFAPGPGAWHFIPVGFNLDFEMKWLFAKAKQYGLLRASARYETIINKPRLDLKDLAVFMNDGRFKGAKLENFSAKIGSGDVVIEAIKRRDYRTIESYVVQETKAFCDLYEALSELMPVFWRETLAPRLGVEAPA